MVLTLLPSAYTSRLVFSKSPIVVSGLADDEVSGNKTEVATGTMINMPVFHFTYQGAMYSARGRVLPNGVYDIEIQCRGFTRRVTSQDFREPSGPGPHFATIDPHRQYLGAGTNALAVMPFTAQDTRRVVVFRIRNWNADRRSVEEILQEVSQVVVLRRRRPGLGVISVGGR